MPPTDALEQGALIAVDWGTSRLRAWLVNGAARPIADRASEEGIARTDGGHEGTFERLTAGWPRAPAIMAGMIGSRQGWREAVYVPCPASPDAIAAGTVLFLADSGREIVVVPGLVDAAGDGDVIRGEETQLIGVIDDTPDFVGTVILPGTHSKWARVNAGSVTGFQTFMTGELFELLSQTSFLRHSVEDRGDDLSESLEFARAIERTTAEGLPFLAGLFPIRARQLLGRVAPAENLAYLSGLVIGGEIAAARTAGRLTRGERLLVVGSRPLARAYGKALAIAGHESEARDGNALVLAGLVRVAGDIGLLAEGG